MTTRRGLFGFLGGALAALGLRKAPTTAGEVWQVTDVTASQIGCVAPGTVVRQASTFVYGGFRVGDRLIVHNLAEEQFDGDIAGAP